MHWDEHPPPHFHAKYGDYEISINIVNGMIEGRFPRRALNLVLEWYDLHNEELFDNWNLCQKQQIPKSIKPLE